MLRNIFSIYTLLVCFVCMIIFMVSLSMLGENAIYLKFPRYSNVTNFDGSSWIVFETNESYLDYYRPKISSMDGSRPSREQEPWLRLSQISSEELTKKRLVEQEKLTKKIYFYAEKDIVHVLPILFISLLLFFLHWGLYRRQKRAAHSE